MLAEVFVGLVQRFVERPIGVSSPDTDAQGACGATLFEDSVVVVHDHTRSQLR